MAKIFRTIRKENQLQLHLANPKTYEEDQARVQENIRQRYHHRFINQTNKRNRLRTCCRTKDGTALFSEVIKTPATGTDFVYFKPSGRIENRLYPPIDKSLEIQIIYNKSKILLLTDDKYETDSTVPYIKNSLQLTVGSGRKHLELKDQEGNYQFGFDLKTMFEPFPRKKLGIDLKIEYLTTSKRNFYIVKDTVFNDFFGKTINPPNQGGIQHYD